MRYNLLEMVLGLIYFRRPTFDFWHRSIPLTLTARQHAHSALIFYENPKLTPMMLLETAPTRYAKSNVYGAASSAIIEASSDAGS